MSADGQVERVRRFYESNAARFERLGQGGTAIHRAVWGPGVRSREEAFHHVEDRLLDLLPPAGAPHVVDLGCGVGGSLLHLAGRRPLTGAGVTISAAQASRATELIARAGLGDRLRVREGDFLAPPDGIAGPSGADLVLSIEAFVHGPDPAAYFRSAARLLRPGGRLAVCDDWLTPAGEAAEQAGGAGARRLAEFRAGWRVGSLVSADRAVAAAAGAGLLPVGDDDLTPYLELRRPRDLVISLALSATRPLRPRSEYWRSLAGGDALQRCLAGGLLSYRLLVLQRAATPPGEP